MMNTKNIAEQIAAVEATARLLEPDAAGRKAIREQVVKYAEEFLDHIHELPAYVSDKPDHKANIFSPVEEPSHLNELLKILKMHVDTPGLNPASGGHLAYIPGGGIYPSSLGDYLAAIFNRYAGIYFPAPGAVKMENSLIRWMCDLIGYPATAHGNLASGGSVANLIAIVTAREALSIKAKDFHRCVIYMTEQAHHSIKKAILIAGLGEAKINHIALDAHYRMNVAELSKSIEADKKEGLIPFMIIASAGTTDTGAIDPINAIADIASSCDLWFHVDAAYGGFFALCEEEEELRDQLIDLRRADSVVMDPHKGLFLPYGTGAVLVKNANELFNAYHLHANYLQDMNGEERELSPADLSPELTKHFRGMRLWLPLMLFGLKPFRAALQEKLLLARYFYEEIKKIRGFEVGPYPDLSVVIYRYVPERGDANLFNQRLVKKIHKDGRIFLSSTTIDGKVFLRLTVLCFRTHLETVQLALKILKEKSEEGF